jgi:hypothetical protein
LSRLITDFQAARAAVRHAGKAGAVGADGASQQRIRIAKVTEAAVASSCTDRIEFDLPRGQTG